ncbi:MAG TPA: VWA domain-containing protein [Chloroflexia bacterium]|nr:VWA domain-containing protein [Chloroflexia bacterium]
MALDEATSWRDQGIAAARAGQTATARAALEQAVRANPQDAEAWFWLAAVQRDPQQALAALERVLALNPHHPRAQAGVAAIRAQLGAGAPPAPAPAPAAPPPASGPVASPFGGIAPAAAPFAPRSASLAAPAASPFAAGTPAPSPFGAAAPPAAGLGSAAPPPFPPPVAPAAGWPAATPGPVPAPDLARLVQQGIAAAQAGRREEARTTLMAVVDQDERNEDAWYWLSTVVDDPQDVEVALENTLQLNPHHAAAAAALQRLQTRPPVVALPIPVYTLDPPPDPPRGGRGWELAPPAEPEDGLRLPTSALRRGEPVPEPPALPPNADEEYLGLLGQVMGKRFRILTLFPTGGTILLLATDMKNGNYVLMRPETATTSKAAKAAVRRGFEHAGKPYVVTNIGLSGISIRVLLRAVGRFPAPQAVDYGLRLIRQARGGRTSLLDRRSWSPDQLVIDQDGALDIRARDRPADVPPPLPAELSPPEHQQGAALDERSDVYLVGALIYYLFTNSPPPAHVPTPRAEAPAGPAKKAPPPRLVAQFRDAPDLPPYLAGVIARALQPDPAARYPDLAALEHVLAPIYVELLKEEKIRSLEPSSLVRALAPAIAGLAVVALLLVGGIALSHRPGPVYAITPTSYLHLLAQTPEPTSTSTLTPDVAASPTVDIFARSSTIDHLTINQIDARRAPQIVVYFSVVSQDNRPVGGLTKDDFTLEHDGVPVTDYQVVNVSDTNEAMSAILVLDISGSMQGTPINEAKNALKQFIGLFTPGDQMGLMTFNDKVKVLHDLTVSRNAVLGEVDGIQAFGDTALYDALYAAVARAGKEGGRTVVVLLSDGKDTASTQYKRADVVQLSKLYSVPIHIVGLNDSADYDAPTLQYIAAHTGGELLQSPDPLQLSDLYTRLAYQIKGQYRLVFTGAALGADHEVRIETKAGDQFVFDAKTYSVK